MNTTLTFNEIHEEFKRALKMNVFSDAVKMFKLYLLAINDKYELDSYENAMVKMYDLYLEAKKSQNDHYGVYTYLNEVFDKHHNPKTGCTQFKL